MPSIDLDAVEARAEAATPGPWVAETFGGTVSIAPAICRGVLAFPATPAGTADAAFIEHARADVPALAAELRAAREVIAAVHAHDTWGHFLAPPVHDALAAYEQTASQDG